MGEKRYPTLLAYRLLFELMMVTFCDMSSSSPNCASVNVKADSVVKLAFCSSVSVVWPKACRLQKAITASKSFFCMLHDFIYFVQSYNFICR